MNAELSHRGSRTPAHSRPIVGALALMTVAATTLQLGPTLKAQSGGRELVTVDFSKAPLGDPPKEVRVTSGKLEVVEKDGVHMLKSGTDSTFIVMVPEKIPNHFALEFDLVPKTSGWTSGPTELSFEGTREVSHSDDSAHVLWNHHRISVIGGGQAYAGGQVDMPEDVKEEIIGFLTKIRAEFNDGNLTVQTNGRTVFESKTAKFLRGRVVRVQLGGEEGDDGAVYLANMRMVALDGGTMQGKGNAPDQTPASTAATTSSTTGTPPPATQTPASTTVPTAPTSQSTTTTASNTPAPAPQAPPPVYAPSPTPTPVTTTPQTTTTTTATGLPRTGGTILQPEPITTTTTATGTPTTGGTIVQPDGTTAPFSSGPRSVSLMPTTTTTTTNTGTTPTPSTLPTLDSADPLPGISTPTVGTEVTGTNTTQPVTAVLATAPTQTGTITPMTAPTTSTQDPAYQPSGGSGAVSPNQSMPASQDSGGSAATSGRYRVVITGFTVAKAQNDDPLNLDGAGNEVFGAAAVLCWNRTTGQQTSFTTVETLTYGDVGANGRFADRIKAGSGSMSGGIVAGNRVPSEYDATGNSIPTSSTDRFPLLVWEGTLTAGVDSVVVCPSIWELDSTRTQFGIYKANWAKSSPSAIMGSSVIANKSSSSTLESVLAPVATAVLSAPPAPTFSGLPTDGYKMAGLTFGPGADRPIGMGLPVIAVLTYQDRFIVVTQENTASIPVGGGTTLSLPLGEPLDPFLGALYTLYVRVERIQ